MIEIVTVQRLSDAEFKLFKAELHELCLRHKVLLEPNSMQLDVSLSTEPRAVDLVNADACP